jgi:large subunit ribosomal protein L5
LYNHTTMTTIKEKVKSAFTTLSKEHALTNVMQAPKITKVIVTSGTGSFKDKKRNQIVAERLARITGQKPSAKLAKKSIAGFKLRENDLVGYQVTLRGERMFDFLEKLVHVAFPRTKDFRGITPDAVDAMGNYSIGVRENTIFPECADEDLKDVFGLGITIVTTSKDKKLTISFLKYLGFPFKKA